MNNRIAYKDILGKPIQAEDVALVVRGMLYANNAGSMAVARATGLGIGKVGRIMGVLESANVVVTNCTGDRTILLRNEAAAINAALRTLRKGNR